MGDLVNLRRVRKTRQRAGDSAQAEANRLHFGRTKAERIASEAQNALADRRLEGHRLTSPPAATDQNDD
jgi:hypothetical protein